MRTTRWSGLWRSSSRGRLRRTGPRCRAPGPVADGAPPRSCHETETNAFRSFDDQPGCRLRGSQLVRNAGGESVQCMLRNVQTFGNAEGGVAIAEVRGTNMKDLIETDPNTVKAEIE